MEQSSEVAGSSPDRFDVRVNVRLATVPARQQEDSGRGRSPGCLTNAMFASPAPLGRRAQTADGGRNWT